MTVGPVGVAYSDDTFGYHQSLLLPLLQLLLLLVLQLKHRPNVIIHV